MKKLKIFANDFYIFSFWVVMHLRSRIIKLCRILKLQYQQIKEGIKKADSLSELIQFERQINQLAANNAGNKELLDKSLYPDDFNSSIEKLRKNLK